MDSMMKPIDVPWELTPMRPHQLEDMFREDDLYVVPSSITLKAGTKIIGDVKFINHCATRMEKWGTLGDAYHDELFNTLRCIVNTRDSIQDQNLLDAIKHFVKNAGTADV